MATQPVSNINTMKANGDKKSCQFYEDMAALHEKEANAIESDARRWKGKADMVRKLRTQAKQYRNMGNYQKNVALVSRPWGYAE